MEMEHWNNQKRDPINAGLIIDELWKCGRYQFFVFNFISILFLCQVTWPLINHDLMHAALVTNCRLPVNASLNESFPYNKISQSYAQCRQWSVFDPQSQINTSRPLKTCNYGFEFQPHADHVNSSTMIELSQFCERSYLSETSKTVFVAGIIVGSLLVPTFADRWGRKPVHIVCQLIGVIVGVSLFFVPNFVGFVVLKFFYGFFNGGTTLTGCVWILELIPNRFRAIAGSGFQIYWIFWWCLLDLIAYFVRDWRWLQLVTSLPPLLSLSFIWLAPESLIWLFTNRKFKDLCYVIRHRADHLNSQVFPVELIGQLQLADQNQTQNLVFASDGVLEIRGHDDPPIEKYTLLDVRKSRRLLIWTITLCYLWFQNISCIYGINQYLTNFTLVNVYITFLLTGFMQLPAYVLAMFLSHYCGRIVPIIVHQFLGASMLIIAAFLPNELYLSNLIISIIARYSFTFCSVVILFYTQEIYPTNVRAAGTGLNYALGHLFALIWAYASVANNKTWILILILGAMALLGGIIVCLLPETKDRIFPENFEELKAWPKSFFSKTMSINRLDDLDHEYFNENESDNDESSNIIFDSNFRSQ